MHAKIPISIVLNYCSHLHMTVMRRTGIVCNLMQLPLLGTNGTVEAPLVILREGGEICGLKLMVN